MSNTICYGPNFLNCEKGSVKKTLTDELFIEVVSLVVMGSERVCPILFLMI
jgi:hypothetical protein